MPEYVPILDVRRSLTTERDLREGDAVLFSGVLWLVVTIELRYLGPPRVRLMPWPNGAEPPAEFHVELESNPGGSESEQPNEDDELSSALPGP